MTDETQLIEKIASREADLVGIYRSIYPTLKAADRIGLPDDVVVDLQTLDPPETIEPSKAAAILKSIKGSTPQDKFQFEYCFGVPMPGGKSLGEFVEDRLREIGIEYHEFWPYLRDRGWLKEG